MSDLETWRKLANELERQPGGRPLTVQALRSACDRIERLERVANWATEVCADLNGRQCPPDPRHVWELSLALAALEQEKPDV